jgi:hypothetical protein
VIATQGRSHRCLLEPLLPPELMTYKHAGAPFCTIILKTDPTTLEGSFSHKKFPYDFFFDSWIFNMYVIYFLIFTNSPNLFGFVFNFTLL